MWLNHWFNDEDYGPETSDVDITNIYLNLIILHISLTQLNKCIFVSLIVLVEIKFRIQLKSMQHCYNLYYSIFSYIDYTYACI